jgi:hypothetical protein
MGILGDSIRRRGSAPASPGDPASAGAGADAMPGLPPLAPDSPQGPPAEPTAAVPANGQPAPASPASDGRSDTRRRRDALAEEVTELHWDLGGLAYEMAIRDHFRLDVLVRRAAVLQERDAELAELERLLRMEEDGVAGTCAACGAPHSRGALFCWQCGATLMARVPSSAASGAEDAATMEHLFPQGAAEAQGEPELAPGDGLAGGAGSEG